MHEVLSCTEYCNDERHVHVQVSLNMRATHVNGTLS